MSYFLETMFNLAFYYPSIFGILLLGVIMLFSFTNILIEETLKFVFKRFK